MGNLGPILRISAGLVLLTITMLMGLDLLGWIPSAQRSETTLRIQVAETLAAQTAGAVRVGDLRNVSRTLRSAVQHNEAMLSAAIRSPMGQLLVHAGDHRQLWTPPANGKSSPSHILVALHEPGQRGETLEIRFESLDARSYFEELADRPLLRIVLVIGISGFISYSFYMRRTLQHLDPSAVIPTRVQATLDVMTEGVVMLDRRGTIVMANDAFATRFGLQPSALMGRDAATLGWRDRLGHEVNGDLPWARSMEEGEPFVGETLTLNRSKRERLVLTVNGAPVLDGWGRPTGSIVTFDDVTELERNRAELQQAMTELEKSRDEIRLRNEELQLLAKSDPLTGVANRRSFMEDVEPLFLQGRDEGYELTCLMVDIDHFKLVNDNHGHLTGDEVIRRVAEGLSTQLSDSGGIVCRYGGEEFCAVLPGSTLEEAEAVGERVRRQISAPGFASVPITVSLGLSSVADGAQELNEMIDYADQALYYSKENGRNRLSRFDRLPAAGRA